MYNLELLEAAMPAVAASLERHGDASSISSITHYTGRAVHILNTELYSYPWNDNKIKQQLVYLAAVCMWFADALHDANLSTEAP